MAYGISKSIYDSGHSTASMPSIAHASLRLRRADCVAKIAAFKYKLANE